MTVYVTADELLDLEHARLALRRDHGLAVDRGRLVREAVALVLADLDENGLDSLLVQRLTETVSRHMTQVADPVEAGAETPGVRGQPRQLRGTLRPAAEPDRQAQARHHRGVPVEGHRRVHRARARPAVPCWDLEQTTSFLLVAATLLDLKAARLLPQGDVEDEEDLALLEARDLLFARLLQYKAFKQVAGVLQTRLAGESRRHPRAVGLEERFATLLPEVLIGIGLDQFAALAAKALEPKPRRSSRCSTSTPPGSACASRRRSSSSGCGARQR